MQSGFISDHSLVRDDYLKYAAMSPPAVTEFDFKIIKQTQQEFVLESNPETVGNVTVGIVISLVVITLFAWYAVSMILMILFVVSLIGAYIPALGWILSFFFGWGLIFEPFKWLLQNAMSIRQTSTQKSICRFSQPLRTITLKQQTRADTVTSEFSFDEVQSIELYRYRGISMILYEIELMIKPRRSLPFSLIRLRLRPELALVIGETDLSKNFVTTPSSGTQNRIVRILLPSRWKLFTSSHRCKWEYHPIPWWFSTAMGQRVPVLEGSSEAPKMQRIKRQIDQLIGL
jgi:hypothetical protein